jgi:hypothetical protein
MLNSTTTFPFAAAWGEVSRRLYQRWATACKTATSYWATTLLVVTGRISASMW